MFRYRRSAILIASVTRRTFSQRLQPPQPEVTGLGLKVWSDYWTHYKKQLIITCGAVATGLVSVGLFWFNSDSKDTTLLSLTQPEDSILRTFEQVSGSEDFKMKDSMATVERIKLQDALRKILLPTAETCQYVVIVGENGTGKSTAIRKMISTLDCGAVYFNCPETASSFSIRLLRTIGYRPSIDFIGGVLRRVEMKTKEEGIVDLNSEPYSTWILVSSMLIKVGTKFRTKYNRPMVLVIDSADVLAKTNPQFLGTIQDFAKNCADMGILRVVFVSSDGSALPLLMSRSAWSRAEKPAFEIGEISDDEAVVFLVKAGVAEDEARLAVANVTGGLFALLNNYISAHKAGKNYDEIVETLDTKTSKALMDLDLSPTHPFFQYLASNQSIKTDNALAKSGVQVEMLLKRNILSAHPNETYTFHDRHVAVWFKNQIVGISDDEAVVFLVKAGVAEAEARLAVANVTGGLFALLNNYVSAHKAGKKYDEIVETLDRNTFESLLDADLSPANALFKCLIAGDTLDLKKAYNLSVSKAKIELLVKRNILSAHPNETYTFHDRHVAVWFKNQNKKGLFTYKGLFT